MKYILPLCVSICLLNSSVFAEENVDDFESLVNEMSDIATKKSLNVDYLPSVVTLIDAQTYIDGGIQNLGEALSMLPGIQMQMTPMGYTTTTVRGLKNPNAYLSDKIKVLIDGVAINNEVGGTSTFYMDFPMQLIQKIEVLRGPASTLYGSGAFYGVVNVITKLGSMKEENRLFLGGGSYKSLSAGANIYTLADNWKIFADGYVAKNEKSLDFEGKSTDTDEKMRDVSVGLKVLYEDFEFLTRFKQSIYGNFYGFEEDLDPIPTNPKEHKNSYFFSQASYKTDLNDVALEAKVGFSYRELDEGANLQKILKIQNEFADEGVLGIDSGFYFSEKLQEQNFEAEVIASFSPIASNEILLGAGARHVLIAQDNYYNSVEDAIMATPDPNVLGMSGTFDYRIEKEPAFWDNPTTSFIKENQNRTIYYAFVEDLIALNERVDVVVGARADHYCDFGAKLSKRASVVYRAQDNAIFKLLYGSAFRAPTFTEAYANGHINYRAGDENIQPEETDTYEAVMIYSPSLYQKFTLNFFYSQLQNVIDLEEYYSTIAGYENYGDRESRGVEFEYNFRTKSEHDLYFNASYIDTDYTTPKEEDNLVSITQSMPDISKVLLKAMYIYRPTSKLSFGTAWQYYGQTTQSQLAWLGDTDTTVQEMHIVDETITYKFSPLSEIRGTIKNLLDEEIKLPSYYYGTDGGVKREGRNYYLSFVQRF